MDESYSVDLDELRTLTSRTEGFASLIAERIRAAESSVTSLSEWWSGPAADAFHLAHHEWVHSAELLVEDIRGLAASACAAHEAYSAALESNSNMLQQGRS